MLTPDSDHLFSIDIAVRDYELDSEGIVNNATYLNYFEMTRHAFCRHCGYSFAEMTADGMVPVVRRIEVDYLEALVSGDVVESRLRVETDGPKFIFRQDLYNKVSGNCVARAKITVVIVEHGRLSRGTRLKEIFGL